MKKINTACLLLSLILMFTLISGCGTGSGSQASSGGSTPTSASATDAPKTPEDTDASEASIYPLSEDVVDLSYFFQIDSTSLSMDHWGGNQVFKDLEVLTNVHIEFMPTSNDAFADQFNVLMNSGTMADIITDFIEGYSYGLEFGVDEGLILDLADYEDYCPNYVSLLKADEGAYKDAHTDNGYMPVFYRLCDEQRIPQSLVIRQDWLDALDMEVPVTYDDVHDVLTVCVLPSVLSGGRHRQIRLCGRRIQGLYHHAQPVVQ